jgi:hypothetical protein
MLFISTQTLSRSGWRIPLTLRNGLKSHLHQSVSELTAHLSPLYIVFICAIARNDSAHLSWFEIQYMPRIKYVQILSQYGACDIIFLCTGQKSCLVPSYRAHAQKANYVT